MTSVPSRAGDAYGRVLAYLDPATLAAWSESSGVKLLVSRWYARVFGFPELAAHRRFAQVREALRRHGGSRVLDLGAGNGLYSLADGIGRPSSGHFLGDVSRRHMRRATATGSSLGLPIWGITCSAEALPLATESVDSVLLIEVLQFIDDDAKAIREIARVLRPGAMWLCEQDRAPAGAALASNPEPRLRKRRAGYTADELCELAAQAGLILEGSQMVSGPVGRRWESIDGRIFGRSRLLHSILFPFIRMVSQLTTPVDASADSGTALYLFRKAAPSGAPSPRTIPAPDA